MLSDELRQALDTVRFEIARGTCTPELWLRFCERVDECADRLAAYERSAGPGPVSRGEVLPANVLPFSPKVVALPRRSVPRRPEPAA